MPVGLTTTIGPGTCSYVFSPDGSALLDFISRKTQLSIIELSAHSVDKIALQDFLNRCVALNYFCYLNDHKLPNPIKITASFSVKCVIDEKHFSSNSENIFFIRIAYMNTSDDLNSNISISYYVSEGLEDIPLFYSAPRIVSYADIELPIENILEYPKGFMVDNKETKDGSYYSNIRLSYRLSYYSEDRPKLNPKDKMLYINYPILFNSI